jgi:hypothetical protein
MDQAGANTLSVIDNCRGPVDDDDNANPYVRFPTVLVLYFRAGLIQPDNETGAVPDLYIVTVHKPFSLRYGFAIVATEERFKSYEMPVSAHRVRPIFLHWLQSKGRNAPLRSLATSGDRNGSPPSQSRQRNLRPPVLTGKNRMGFWHTGQEGGGVFLGMTLTLDQAQALSAHSHRLMPRLGR